MRSRFTGPNKEYDHILVTLSVGRIYPEPKTLLFGRPTPKKLFMRFASQGSFFVSSSSWAKP